VSRRCESLWVYEKPSPQHVADLAKGTAGVSAACCLLPMTTPVLTVLATLYLVAAVYWTRAVLRRLDAIQDSLLRVNRSIRQQDTNATKELHE
jgi:hypothetical protein